VLNEKISLELIPDDSAMSICLDEDHDNVEKKKVDKISGQWHRISMRITVNH
jgi:hypothetical protein